MRILVTGGTGFVGSHIAVGLQNAGHDVRLLVRRPEQVPTTFEPFGATFTDIAQGDVLDKASIETALTDCDAVVHAAAIFTFDRRKAGEMLTTNEQATDNVLGSAADAGIERIVHISTTVALNGRGTIPADLPLGDIDLPYTKSKIASERVARQFQDAGAPVTCVYPGGVTGPFDPYHGDSDQRLAFIARGLGTFWAAGATHNVDARDVADVVVAVVEGKGKAPHRYVVPGHLADGSMLFRAVSRAIGRRRPMLAMPGPAARLMARGVNLIQRFTGTRLIPADKEAVEVNLCRALFDTSPATNDLGVTAMPFEESIRDEITWLVDSGRLPRKYLPA